MVVQFPSDPCWIYLLPFPWACAAHPPSFIILCLLFFSFLLVFVFYISPIFFGYLSLLFSFYFMYMFLLCLAILQLVVAALSWAVLI
jgi:hypothetical protein